MLKNFNSQHGLSLLGRVLDQVSFLNFQVQTGQPFFVLQSVIKSNKNIYLTHKRKTEYWVTKLSIYIKTHKEGCSFSV